MRADRAEDRDRSGVMGAGMGAGMRAGAAAGRDADRDRDRDGVVGRMEDRLDSERDDVHGSADDRDRDGQRDGVVGRVEDRLDGDRGSSGVGWRDGAQDRTDDSSRRSSEHDGAGAGTAAAVGAGGLAAVAAAAAADQRGDRSDRTDVRADRTDRTDAPFDATDDGTSGRHAQTADWRDASGGRSASGLSSVPVAGSAERTGAGSGASGGARQARLSKWVLVERSAVIDVTEEEAQRLAAAHGTDGPGSAQR